MRNLFLFVSFMVAVVAMGLFLIAKPEAMAQQQVESGERGAVIVMGREYPAIPREELELFIGWDVLQDYLPERFQDSEVTVTDEALLEALTEAWQVRIRAYNQSLEQLTEILLPTYAEIYPDADRAFVRFIIAEQFASNAGNTISEEVQRAHNEAMALYYARTAVARAMGVDDPDL